MPRFIKFALLTIAAFLVLGFSVGSAANANAATISVSPTDNAVRKDGVEIPGSPFATNWDAIQAAVNAANPNGGDVVELLAGTFSLEKAMTYDDNPVVSCSAYGSSYFDWFSWQRGSGLDPYAPIMIDRPVTIRGQRTDAGYLTTVVADSVHRGAGFINHNDARVRFENIEFSDMMGPFVPMAPYEIAGCRFDGVQSPLWGQFIDERIIFPGLSQGDTSGYEKSVIEDSSFVNLMSVGPQLGAGQTMQNCTFGDDSNPVVHPDDPYFYFAAELNSRYAYIEVLEDSWPFEPGKLQARDLYEAHILHNVVDNSQGKHWYEPGNGRWGDTVFMIVNHGFDQEFRNLSIVGNHIRNSKAWSWGLWVGTAVQWQKYYGITPIREAEGIRNIDIRDNIFEGSCFGWQGIEVFNDDLNSSVEDVRVVGNVFTGSRTPDGLYGEGAAISFEWWAHPGPALKNCTVAGNDLINSGYPAISDAPWSWYFDASVFLDDSTSQCTVFQTGLFPPGQGDAKFHITDLGAGNRVIGLSANTAVFPRGIDKTVHVVLEGDLRRTRTREW